MSARELEVPQKYVLAHHRCVRACHRVQSHQVLLGPAAQRNPVLDRAIARHVPLPHVVCALERAGALPHALEYDVPLTRVGVDACHAGGDHGVPC